MVQVLNHSPIPALDADAEAPDLLRHSGHPVLGRDGDGQDRVPPARDRKGLVLRLPAGQQRPLVLLGAVDRPESGD